MAKKKITTPEGTKIKRALPFKLTAEEKAEKGELAAKMDKQIEAALEVKKAEVKTHTEKISALEKKRRAALTAIGEGVERREVTATEVKNYEKNRVEYWFEDKMLEDRIMTPDDRQQALKPIKGGKKSAKGFQRFPVSSQDAKEMEEDRVEIAQVHKLETGRNTANSAVDPK